MTGVRVLAATAARLPDARALVFEYMASTQREAGRAVPGSIAELPPVLRTECADLTTAYRPPGVLLLAYHGRVQPVDPGAAWSERLTGSRSRDSRTMWAIPGRGLFTVTATATVRPCCSTRPG